MLKEKRVFKPSAKFAEAARIGSLKKYQKLYKASLKNPDKFWGKAAEDLTWFRTWKESLRVETAVRASGSWAAKSTPASTASTGISRGRCATRRRSFSRASRATCVTLTYQQLHREVCLMANVLKKHGVKSGDRVMIYLPMIPEAVIAMLACARIGAPHSVVFSGFSAEALKERINDCGAKVHHHVRRRIPPRRGPRRSRRNVDEALLGAPEGQERDRRPAHQAGSRP